MATATRSVDRKVSRTRAASYRPYLSTSAPTLARCHFLPQLSVESCPFAAWHIRLPAAARFPLRRHVLAVSMRWRARFEMHCGAQVTRYLLSSQCRIMRSCWKEGAFSWSRLLGFGTRVAPCSIAENKFENLLKLHRTALSDSAGPGCGESMPRQLAAHHAASLRRLVLLF